MLPNDRTENTSYSQAVLTLLGNADAIVPEIWPFEIANNMFVSLNRRGRIKEEQLKQYLNLISSLPIRVDRRSWKEHLTLKSLARKHEITAYDAAYLEVAKRRALSLATSDGQA